ncbi:dipeptidase [Flavobacterium sp. 3HN19-14]|uniref:dipeptidase n=1 Tax=Flavobacterium sp. 3HN19-14 TaxID=3448133 RepID=UPI003EE1428A
MEKLHYDWSRRSFITTMATAGMGFLIDPKLSWTTTQTDPKVTALVAKIMGIDTHNHIDVPLNAADLPVTDLDLKGEMKKSGLSAICMTFAVDYQELRNPGDAYERFLNGMTAIDKVLENNNMKRAFTVADLNKAHHEKQPIVIQSVEGAHFLEGHIDRLKIAYDRGLRHLGLLHDHDASVPLGDVFTNPAQWGGLTTFGSDVIKECNRLGILADLSHATNETVNAALKIAEHPVLVSHTGLDTRLGKNEQMAKMMRPRLISKEQAKIVAETGGVVGVWTHLADSPQEYAENIRAMVDVIGADHVCIGTDTKLASKGGRPGQGTNESWKDQNDGFLYVVVEAMLKAGFSENEIAKIGGGNFCRIFEAATAGHQ